MAGLFFWLVLLGAVYLFFRSRILGKFTDPVTRSNQKRLGRYLLILTGLLLLLIVWIGMSVSR